MRLFPVLAVAAVGVLGIAGIAYAADMADDENPPLPPPEKCSSAEDVGVATSDLLADNTITAQGYRAAANTLRNWTTYCDDAAKQAGQASVVLLEAKAAQLEAFPYNQGAPAGGIPPSPLPNPTSYPQGFPGIVGSKQTTGLHNEQGTVYWYGNSDMWFVPNDPYLVPYFIPGGSNDITTEGAACCGACSAGHECETGCQGA